ncbi:CBS domain-containing protein [Microbispora hainanensis]|jgi:CBS domain-containing protein|uniref:CBS domain-containing protein n=1 Tax=Microbispora hainanensis TaxID=568844 RepID=A0ABZ1SRL7_9ACTN|nr:MULTISPECIES: CBS domain-containing protein [Microbispora]NJP26204.1 CBS domain-containing protein [Microbispora sp. CL1-1]TQS12631.1 CBS domain-containing protein [Microbispora sp. SCL1-1]
MLVHEIMTTPVVTVPRTWTIKQAVRLLYEKDITAAPVVDENGRMVGIVSEMDLLRGEYGANPRAFLRPEAPPTSRPPALVEEVMTPHVRTVAEDADTMEVVELMITTGVKSVPVVHDGELVGIVSRRDLMGLLAHGDERIREDVLAALRDCAETASFGAAVRDGVVELYGPGDERSARIAELVARTVPGVVDVVFPEGTVS